MNDRQFQEPLNESPPIEREPTQSLANASAEGCHQGNWGSTQDSEWKARLWNLQQCICELLIKNQQLRDSLACATNHRFPASGDE